MIGLCVAAVVAVVAAALLVGAADVRAGRWDAYLSELSGPLYTSGVLLAALAAVLLAGAYVLRRRFGPAVALAFAAVALAGSATVPCTAGCPLPVADGIVPLQDAFHAFISVFAFFAFAAAAALDERPVVAVVMTAAIMVLFGWAVLIRSHDVVPAVAERFAAVVVAAWAVTAAIRLWRADER
ncbi:DUF998 domain-containing protein [Fodinicola acaciae]|uniref:DUF998 domain-containing protein n=1 Tax=Fodinicola acaciae TaxID=2681555 RepID=UPI0013D792C7|nr:DUF998 domain-containing protein [Fodinicola acaciae]